jgi:cytoskeletal protein CcmA (bactofilin family)
MMTHGTGRCLDLDNKLYKQQETNIYTDIFFLLQCVSKMYFYVTIILYAMSTNTNNIGIGVRALDTNTGGSYNIGIGTNSLTDKGSGSYNTAIGTESGATDINTSYNTFLGANTDIATTTAPTNSTAIGYNAKINESNQIVMGTASEYVCIPGQLSIGKVNVNISDSRKPASGVGLDVTGKLIVSNDISGNGSLRIANNIFSNGTLFVAGDISGNSNLKIKDISANALTLGGRLVAQDISGQGLTLTTKLLVQGDISGNSNLTIKDISANALTLGGRLFAKDISGNGLTLETNLHIKGDISGNTMRIRDVSANIVTINKLFVGKTEITTNGSIADGSNNTILGGFGTRPSLSRSDVSNSTAVGYAAIIDSSNQIVLGTSGEFVCIPSNTGLSIGKNSKPTSMLDVSGSSIVSGDLTIRGTYYGDPSSNIKIGGVTNKTNGPINTSYTTNPTTNLKLTIDNTGSIYLVNESGSVVNYAGYVIESTTGFNSYIYSATFNVTINKNGISLPNIVVNENGVIWTGLSSDKRVYFNLNRSNNRTFQLLGSSTNLISSTLYNYNSSGQTIHIYIGMLNEVTAGSDYINVSGFIYNRAASIYIPPSPIIPRNSTYLGANIKYLSDVDTSTSTAIGYGANIDVSNQIVLGTSGEFVCIPSNRGLSIGKSTAPSSSYALDISGSILLTGDISGNNMKIKDISANAITLGARLFAQDISGQGLSLTNKLFVQGDICGNNLTIKDISANALTLVGRLFAQDISGQGLSLTNKLFVQGDICGNNLKIKDVSANALTLGGRLFAQDISGQGLSLTNKLFVQGDICGNNLTIKDVSANALTLGGRLFAQDISGQGLSLTNKLFVQGDICGNNLTIKDISANAITLGARLFAQDISGQGLSLTNKLFVQGDICGNNLTIKDVSANALTLGGRLFAQDISGQGLSLTNKLFVQGDICGNNLTIKDVSANALTLGGRLFAQDISGQGLSLTNKLFVQGDICGNNLTIKDISANAITLGGRLFAQDISGQGLSLTNKLFVQGDISGNNLTIKDVSANALTLGGRLFAQDISGQGLSLTNKLFVQGDISGNNLTIKDVSANALTLVGRLFAQDISGQGLSLTNKLFVQGDICGNNLTIKDVSANALTLGGRLFAQDISGQGLSLTNKLFVQGDICGNNLTIKDVSANALTLGGRLFAQDISGQGLSLTNKLFVQGDICGNNLTIKDISANALTLGGRLFAQDISGQGLTLNTNLHVIGDISGNTMKIKDISANAITLGGRLFAQDISGQGLSLTNKLFVQGDISGNNLTIKDVSANALTLGGRLFAQDISGQGLSLTNKLFVQGDICGNNLTIKDVSANALTMGGRLFAQDISGQGLTLNTNLHVIGDISGNTMKIKDVSANALTLGGRLFAQDISGQGLTLTTNLFVQGDISGNTMKIKDVSANALTLGGRFFAKDISANGLTLESNLHIKGDISGNNLKIKDVSANIVTINKLFVGTTEITSNGSTADGSNNTILGGFGKTIMSSIKSGVNAFNSTAVGYAAIIDSSNQIVLGTSGEFVCIPSNTGLSVGNNSKPASMLDVSGSSIISGDLTIRGTFYGDSSNSVKIGSGIKNNEVVNTPYTTNPATIAKLTLDNTGSISLVNQTGSALTYYGYVLESTTGFNGVVTNTGMQINWLIDGISQEPIYTKNGGLKTIGLSTDKKIWLNTSGGSNTFQYLDKSTNLIDSTLYKYSMSGQTINIYYLLPSLIGPGPANNPGPGINYRFGSYYYQKVASMYIPPAPPQNSTYLGANITYPSNFNISNSTAIGYGANIDVSNQIVLGTSGEFVCIPSNRGLSIGKSTEPGYIDPNFTYPGVGLDVSGTALVSGDIYTGSIFFNNGIRIGRAQNQLLQQTYVWNSSVAIGDGCLFTGSGSSITAVGNVSLSDNTSDYNTAIGYRSLEGNKTGANNTAIGYQSGRKNCPVPRQYMKTDTSGNNTFLGAETGLWLDTNNTNIQYSTAIGYGAWVDASFQIVLGVPSNFTCIPGSMSIGAYAKPTSSLNIKGNMLVTTPDTFNNLIDTSGSNTFRATSSNSIISTGSGTNTIQTTSGTNLIKSDTGQIRLNTGGTSNTSIMLDVSGNSGGITLQTTGTSSLININAKTGIRDLIDSTEKLSHTSVLTKITNANVDISANLNASSYRVGTNALSVPLLSHMMPVIWRLPNTHATGVVAPYNTSFCLNSASTLTAPEISNLPFGLILHGCSVHYDSGTITGGTTMTYIVKVVNAAGGTTYGDTTSSTITSTSNLNPPYLKFNNVIRIPPSTRVNVQITLTASVAITASTKSVQFNIYSQQC